jgi:pyruvate kinase
MRWSGCRSKIVCTIGPASDKEATLRKMIQAGMRVARINLAHGTPEEHGSRIQRIRRAAIAESKRMIKKKKISKKKEIKKKIRIN